MSEQTCNESSGFPDWDADKPVYSPPGPPPIPGDLIVPAEPAVAREPRGRDILKVVVIVLLVQFFIGVVLGIGLSASARHSGRDAAVIPPFVMPLLALVFEGTLVLLTYWFACLKYGRTFVAGLSLHLPSRRQVRNAAVFGFALALLGGTISVLHAAFHPDKMADTPLTQILSSYAGMVAFMVVALLAPFAEEIFFRGFMLPVLVRKWTTVPAVAVTTGTFALMHGHQLGWDAISLLMIAGVGLILCVQRIRTGSTFLCIITHWFYNLVLVMIIGTASLAMNFAHHPEATDAVARVSMPTPEEMKEDLVGRRISNGKAAWAFDSVEEFTQFEITDQHEGASETVFHIAVRLHGMIGPDAEATIEVTYSRDQEGYRFAKVEENGTLRAVPRQEASESTQISS